jgi:hypothetical protein
MPPHLDKPATAKIVHRPAGHGELSICHILKDHLMALETATELAAFNLALAILKVDNVACAIEISHLTFGRGGNAQGVYELTKGLEHIFCPLSFSLV